MLINKPACKKLDACEWCMEKVEFFVKKEGGFNVTWESRLTFTLGILRALDIANCVSYMT